MGATHAFSAPKVQRYLDWLGSIEYRDFRNDTTYDEKSRQLIDRLFSEVQQIEPERGSGSLKWSMWFHADRGPLEDFADCEEWIRSGDAQDEEDCIRIWHDFFPYEEEWYPITLLVDTKSNYRAVFVKHEHVIEIDPSKPGNGYPHDISEFVQWLLDSLAGCIAQLREGTYNDIVKKRLPHQHRVGTILRNDYWSVFPEEREGFFSNISDEEVSAAIALMSKQPDDEHFEDRIPGMTANLFYQACAVGYIANNYKYTDLSPKEMYYRHADGRDEGLREIDLGSEEAFQLWYSDPERFGGHPWEVCRGGNSTHVSLQVAYDEKGYFFYLAGRAETRCIETIKFFLALRKEGYPVFLCDAKELVARLKGEERIGIVPDGIIPRYCSSWFPNETIIDYMNLPDENRDEIVKLTVWQPLTPVKLAEQV